MEILVLLLDFGVRILTEFCSEFINLQSPKKNYCLRQLKVILKVMLINFTTL